MNTLYLCSYLPWIKSPNRNTAGQGPPNRSGNRNLTRRPATGKTRKERSQILAVRFGLPPSICVCKSQRILNFALQFATRDASNISRNWNKYTYVEMLIEYEINLCIMYWVLSCSYMYLFTDQLKLVIVKTLVATKLQDVSRFTSSWIFAQENTFCFL